MQDEQAAASSSLHNVQHLKMAHLRLAQLPPPVLQQVHPRERLSE
jgi:hypothetical protein